MAIFGDIATIRTCIEPFTCISPSLTPYGQDKIIFSESKHLAVLYDLNTCLPIKCWTFSELDSLVAPLIYDHVNEKFVAVKQLKVALYKCDSEDDLVQVRLGKSIHCLLSSSIKESLVLFKNGVVRPLGSVVAEKVKFPGDGFIPENEEIIKTTINQFDPESSWVALLTKTQNCFNKLYLIKADFISGLGKLDAKYTVKQSYKCLTMTKSGKPIGLTENGNIHLLDVDGDQLLLSLRDSTTISALCLPEEDTLAVVVREEETFSLKIVNLKFKVITCQLPLDIVPLPDFISQSNGKLFIASPKAMLCIQYEIKPATLASVMGKNFVPNNKNCKQQLSSDHIFLDSSTDIKITTMLTDGITLNELKKLLPKTDEILGERAIFSALATILKAKCFSPQDTMCKELLNSIISRPFNHNYMVSVVKSTNLSADQFVQIIDILIEMLQIDNGFIIDWLIVILDACLKLLLLTKSELIKNTLKKLDEKLIMMEESLEKCQEISILLDDLLTSKTKLSNNSMYNGIKHDKYCIEVLEL